MNTPQQAAINRIQQTTRERIRRGVAFINLHYPNAPIDAVQALADAHWRREAELKAELEKKNQ